MWRVNVLATRNRIAAAVAHGVRRFVHVSSIVAYGNAAVGEIDEVGLEEGMRRSETWAREQGLL